MLTLVAGRRTMTAMGLRRLLAWTTLGALIGAVVLYGIGLVAFAVNTFNAAASCMIVAGLGVIAIGCVLPAERGKLVWLMRAGLIAVAGSAVLWLATVWTMWQGRWVYQVGSTMTTFAVLVMLIGLLMLPRIHLRVAWLLRQLTIVLLLPCAGALVALIWSDPRSTPPIASETMTVLFVLCACSGAMALVTARWTDIDTGDEAELIRLPFAITCPRCGSRQTLHTGGDRCAACALRIKVSVP